jgi:hypothetical protein
VIVITTEPAAISAAEGVYVVVAVVVLLKVPVPAVLHVNEVALPPIDPVIETVLLAQIVLSIPAFAVAA